MNDSPHEEYFKWIAAKKFKPAMDQALAADTDNFAKKLMEVKKVTSVLIDGGRTQPFYGLVKFAEREPETVREMFKALYAEDNGDVQIKQDKIFDFISKSLVLRDKYYYNSHLYTDTFHSVSAYMFLYDPDHNYLFKYSHGREFAKYTDFGDDWGSGKNTKLKVYYRMCDQLVQYMKQDAALMELDASRFTRGLAAPGEMHPDKEKHILAFDIIYCAHTYNLYGDIILPPGNPDQRETAVKLFKKWQAAKENYDYLEEGKDYINSVFQPGIKIHHVSYGDGIIQKNTGTQIEVLYDTVGTKKQATFKSAALGLILADVPGYDEIIENYKDCIKKEDTIKIALGASRTDLIPYLEYLDEYNREIFKAEG